MAIWDELFGPSADVQRLQQQVNALQNALQLQLITGQVNLTGGAQPTGAAGGVLGGTYPSPAFVTGAAASGIIVSGMIGAAVTLSNVASVVPRFITGTYQGNGSQTQVFTSDAGGGWQPRVIEVCGANATLVTQVAHATWGNVSGQIVTGQVRDVQGTAVAGITSALCGPSTSGVLFGGNTGIGLSVSGNLYTYGIFG